MRIIYTSQMVDIVIMAQYTVFHEKRFNLVQCLKAESW